MKKKRIVWSIVAALLLALVVWVVVENTTVGVTHITVTEKELPRGLDGLRIAQISDLHNSWLWEQTIALLKEEKPDIIVITGDMVDWKRTDVDAALAFAREAVQIAGCFYITGNHEEKMPVEYRTQLLDGLRGLGVVVMENSQTVIHHNGAYFALVGHRWGSGVSLSDLPEYDGYRILLHHQPEALADFAAAGFDLVFSGHAHGGQARLPFIGGIFAPNQGLFPKYDAGHYVSGDTDLIVSRGIGNSSFPIRFNNRPEVVIVELDQG